MRWLALVIAVLLLVRFFTRRENRLLKEAARASTIDDLTSITWHDDRGGLAGAPSQGEPLTPQAGSLALSYAPRMVVGRPRAFVVRLSREFIDRIAKDQRVPGEDKANALRQQPLMLAPVVDVELQPDPAYLTANKTAGRPSPTPSSSNIGDLPIWIWNLTPIKSGTAEIAVRVIDVANPGRSLVDPRIMISVRSRWARALFSLLGKAIWAGIAALAIWFWSVYVQPQDWGPVISAIRQRDWYGVLNALMALTKAVWEEVLKSVS